MSNTSNTGTTMPCQKRGKMKTPKRVKYLSVPAFSDAGNRPFEPKQPIAAAKFRHAHSWNSESVEQWCWNRSGGFYPSSTGVLPCWFSTTTLVPPESRLVPTRIPPCCSAGVFSPPPCSYPNPTRIPPLHRVHMLQPCVGAYDLVGIHPLLWAALASWKQERQV